MMQERNKRKKEEMEAEVWIVFHNFDYIAYLLFIQELDCC